MSTLEEIEALPTRFFSTATPTQSDTERTRCIHLPLEAVALKARVYKNAEMQSLLESDSALRSLKETSHYAGNIAAVLGFLIDETVGEARSRYHWIEKMQRVKIDLEKLWSDVRSFLDPIFRLALAFSGDTSFIPNKRKKSFGKFCDWRETEGKSAVMPTPLCFLDEVSGWAQTIRSLRDNHVHGAHDMIVFTSERPFGMMLNPRATQPYGRFPSAFYVAGNPNHLLDFPCFLAWTVAPVYAIGFSMGDWLNQRITGESLKSEAGQLGQVYTTGPFVANLEKLFIEHPVALERKNYSARFLVRNRDE